MTIHLGDCIEVMAGMEAASVDSIVTDPPAGIAFMGKTWDHNKGGRTQWVAWMTAVMSECLRVLKPGGWLVCWSLPRTSHWTAWAIEDAGFRLTDVLLHVFASGFPKGRSQMKPAYEPWILARKPGPLRELAIDRCRIGVDGGVTRHTVSAGTHRDRWEGNRATGEITDNGGRWPANVMLTADEDGRAIFDGDTPGVVGGGDTGPAGASGYDWTESVNDNPSHVTRNIKSGVHHGDSGTYSRFFLLPKAARSEREPVLGGQIRTVKRGILGTGIGGADNLGVERENSHPTVKPLDLMRHLVRLVTPTGGTVLDPFAGSGTTLLAAELEGFPWLGIEREAEYVAIIEARLNGTQRGLGLPA